MAEICGASTTGNIGVSRMKTDISPRSRKVKPEKSKKRKSKILTIKELLS